MSVMKYYKRITAIVLFIAVTICSILPTGLEARAAEVTESNPMYRLYNPNSGEHFYTADEGEKDYLSEIGWNYEGIGWNAPVSSNSPVYRLYNPYSSDHHYTMDEGERDYLSQTGWNYEGIGWYSDDARSVPLYRQFNPNEVIGTHNYTKSLEENDWLCTTGWQAEGIGWYGVHSSEDEEGNEPLVATEKSVGAYFVSGISLDKNSNSVRVGVGAPGDCRLNVRFVPEDVYFSDGYYSGKSYINDGNTNAYCDVSAADEIKEVSASINNYASLPEHFVIEAVLVDANGNNLCNPYTTIDFTEKHEEFDAMNVDSFPGQNVVNFDNDMTTNFGVFTDDVKVVTATTVTEEVNEDRSKKYTITSPSEDIEVGDKVYLKDNNSEYLFKVATKDKLSDGIIKVKTARANDQRLGFDIDDFFTYLDVDMSDDVTNLDKKYAKHESASISQDYTLTLPKFDLNQIKVNASVTGRMVIDIDVEKYGEYINKFDYKCTVENTEKLSATPNTKNGGEIKKEIDFAHVPIDVVPVFLDVYVDFDLKLSCKLSAEFVAEGKTKNISGIHYNGVDDYTPIKSKDETWSIYPKGELEIKIGPVISVGTEVLHGALSAGLEAFVGVAATATVEANLGGNSDHACTICATGNAKACLDIKLYIEIVDEKFRPVEVTLFKEEIPIFDFYVSIASPKNSTFHGKLHFGKGQCPNKYVDDAEKIDIEVNYVTVESSVINQSTGNPVFVGRYPVFTVKTKGYEKLQNRLNKLSNENKAKVESYMLSEEQNSAGRDTSSYPYGHSYNYYIEIYRSDNNILSFSEGGIYNTLYNGSPLGGDVMKYTYYNINSKTGEDNTADVFITDIDKASDAIVKEFFLKYPNLRLISESELKKLIMSEYNDGSLKYIMYNDFVEFVFEEDITLDKYSVDVSYDEL